MLKTITLRVACIIMTPDLQSASFSDRQDVQRARDSERSSTYVTVDSWDYSAFERVPAESDLRATADFALHPDWNLRLEGQTERCQFPLLPSMEQRNAALTLQLSYNPPWRLRQ